MKKYLLPLGALCMVVIVPMVALAQVVEGEAFDLAELVKAMLDSYKALGWLGVVSVLGFAGVKALRYFAPSLWDGLGTWTKVTVVFGAAFVAALASGAGTAVVAGAGLWAALAGALVPALVAAIPAALGAMGLRKMEKMARPPLVAGQAANSIEVPLPKPADAPKP